MAKDTRRFQRLQLDERLREWLRELGASPQQEMLRSLGLKIDLTPPKPKPRKKKGGRKPLLTPEEIALVQAAYRQALQTDPTLKKQAAALWYLRPLLPSILPDEDKRDVSDDTLLRHVIRPVRGVFAG